MIWRCGKKSLLASLFLSLLLVLVSEAPLSITDQPLLIYESELNKLLVNVTMLSRLNLQQKRQLVDLQADLTKQREESIALRKESEDLQLKLVNLQRQIDDLLMELAGLKADLKSSQVVLGELRIQLQKAEDSYKSLWESFLVYQKEVEKQINSLKADKVFLTFWMIVGWASGVVFAVLWLIEHFSLKLI